jgi:hypothetical protein
LNGEWNKKIVIKSDEKGSLKVPVFPDDKNPSSRDWAAKIVLK